MVDLLRILVEQRESQRVGAGLHGELEIGGDVIAHIDQADGFAVYGHFDFRDAVVVGNAAATLHLERVHAVEREIMTNGQTAGGSQRNVFRHRRVPVCGCRGADGGVAYGQAADLRRRGDIAVHQRRRYAQHVGHVVETLGRVVGGEERRDVNIQREQIANRVAVLVAVQTMERGRSRIGMRGSRAVELSFEGRREGIERGAIRPRRACRRHHAGADLPDHLLPRLRRCRAFGGAVWIELLENQIPCFQALVVARNAVLIQQGGFLRSRNFGVSRRYGDRDDPGDGNQPHWGDVASFCSNATVLDFRSGGLPAR